MRYSELKDRATYLETEEKALRRIRTREWIMPDKSLIRVEVNPTFDNMISLTFSRFIPEQGATITLYDGRQIEGGYLDYCMHLDRISSQQLEWLSRARLMAERYVEGSIDSLPDTLL